MANLGIKAARRWLAAACLIGNLVVASPAFAQDATWLNAPTVTNPADGNFNFNAPANWNPATVPGSNTQTGTATFGATTTPAGANISFSAATTTLGGFTLTGLASNYVFTNTKILTFNGAGIVINGGSANITNNNHGQTAFNGSSTAGNANITNSSGGVIQFGQSRGTDTSTAGNATITNNGPAAIFFFASTTAGSANITNNNGGIQFFDTSTAGTAVITNNSGGVTQFFDTSTAGTAVITNNSGGGELFDATSTAGSAVITNNNGGVVGFNNASTAGNATITNSGGVTRFGDTSTAGNAVITNNNGGITQFLGASTAGNAHITNNSGGSTQFGQFVTDTSTAGNAVITNNSGSFTNFKGASTAGSANITNNSGSTAFNDTSTAGSAIITNNSIGGIGGFVGFNNASTAGSAIITNNGSDSGVSFNDTSTAGNAHITNNSGGVTQFGVNGGTDTSTAGNAIITNNNGGETLFRANNTAGNAIITNNNGGSVTFFANSTGGNARLITNSGGFVNFSPSIGPLGNNQLSAGSIEGAGQFFLGANQLTVGGNNLSTNVSGSILDGLGGVTTGGSLVKTGSGTLTLSGVNTYTGATTVNAGTLEVDGSIVTSSAVTVSSGGTLSGTGIISSTSINSLGTLTPGNAANPTGTLTVTGNLAFQSGALYLIQVSGANAGQIAVAGTATLAGNVAVDVLSRLTQKTTYTILSSSGLNNTNFGNVTLEFANNFARDPVLSYVGNNVLLTLQPGLLSPVLPGNASANQVKVAGAIDNALLAGNNLSNAFGAIFNLSGNGLLNGLTQISGETATGSQQTTFNAMGQFMGLLTDPFMNRGGGFNVAPGASGYAEEAASAYAATNKKTDAFAMFNKAPPTFEQRWSVWASAFGGSQSTSGNVVAGSNNTTSNIAGTAVGADYLFSPHTIAGFALAGGGTNFSVANGGTGRSDLFQIGAYVRHTSGPAYISASLAYGWQDITTNRTVMVAGLDQLRAEFNANAWSGRIEGGYRFVSPWIGGIGIAPYAAAQFVAFDLPRYAEQAIVGLNTFALNYGARDVTDPRSELGVRADKSFAMSDGLLTLRGRFAWAHDYDPNRSIAATFQSLPGGSFVVNGAAQAADSALTTASIEKKWKNGWSAAATFEGEFSGVTSSYAGKGVARYVW